MIAFVILPGKHIWVFCTMRVWKLAMTLRLGGLEIAEWAPSVRPASEGR